MSFTSITNNTRLFNNNIMDMERLDQETNDDNNNTTNTQACSCTTENGSESPLSNSTMFNDLSRNQHHHHNLIATTTNSSASTISSSPKKSNGRRSVHKRVVSIPIKEVEASRLKGEGCHASTPPSDSWAWRKYGQKPIKGSPYPRGYYRCSSSKGCPARKQVERSRVDPTMIMVTYSAEHNHPWPPTSSRNNQNNHNKHQSSAAASAALVSKKPVMVKEELSDEAMEEICSPQPAAAAEPDVAPEAAEERYVGLMVGGAGGDDDEFAGWFGGHVEATLQSPIFTEERGGACESLAAAVFPMREEDESLFADLGELPECSLVFRHRGVGPQVEIC